MNLVIFFPINIYIPFIWISKSFQAHLRRVLEYWHYSIYCNPFIGLTFWVDSWFNTFKKFRIILASKLPLLFRCSEDMYWVFFTVCRNPGSTPDWLGSVIVAVFVAIILCLTSVYLLSYLHLSGFFLLYIYFLTLYNRLCFSYHQCHF